MPSGLIVMTIRPGRKPHHQVTDALLKAQKETSAWPIYFRDDAPFGDPGDVKTPRELLTKRMNLAFALNEARQAFLNDDFEYFVHVESDTSIPPNAIPELLEAIHVEKSDIAVGIQRLKHPPCHLSCARQDPKYGWDVIKPINLTMEDLKQRFIPVDWYSLGCILIKKCVLEKVKFRAEVGPGVDWTFGQDAYELGHKCICCCRVRCGHVRDNGEVIMI